MATALVPHQPAVTALGLGYISSQDQVTPSPFIAPLPYSTTTYPHPAPSLATSWRAPGVQLDLTFITSRAHLQDSLSPYAGGPPRANTLDTPPNRLLRSPLHPRHAVYLLVVLDVSVATRALSATPALLPRLRPRESPTLAADQRRFFAAFGDSYVHAIRAGGALYALLEFHPRPGDSVPALRTRAQRASQNLPDAQSALQRVVDVLAAPPPPTTTSTTSAPAANAQDPPDPAPVPRANFDSARADVTVGVTAAVSAEIEEEADKLEDVTYSSVVLATVGGPPLPLGLHVRSVPALVRVFPLLVKGLDTGPGPGPGPGPDVFADIKAVLPGVTVDSLRGVAVPTRVELRQYNDLQVFIGYQLPFSPASRSGIRDLKNHFRLELRYKDEVTKYLNDSVVVGGLPPAKLVVLDNVRANYRSRGLRIIEALRSYLDGTEEQRQQALQTLDSLSSSVETDIADVRQIVAPLLQET